jgi:alpha-N-arabinofuranosidase
MGKDELFEHIPAAEEQRATVWVDPAVRSTYQISPLLLGKFCEHLGTNINHGMEAQILFNPTFGHWSFTASGPGISRPDGGVAFEPNTERIAAQARHAGERMGLHSAELLMRDLDAGCAFGWVRLGDVEAVRTSPDVGPYRDRAQRIEILSAGSGGALGIASRTYLPLHRTRGFVYRIVGRAHEPVQVTLSIAQVDAGGEVGPALASGEVELEEEWGTHTGMLWIPAGTALDPEGVFQVSLAVPPGANVVVDRLLLYPDDHVGHADPDVIGMLRQVQLPLLRWPGGNFVSGYHWRDGVGPVDARPTRPNPAWPGLEPNLFGTDEFVAFCRAVGCEPMICVNAGNGSPEEAAAWVAYCNAGTDTPMGHLRAENGHPEPYGVRIWEIGNEIYGRWQVGWTTPGGYLDRYHRFVQAMREADPAIQILACGEQLVGLESEWNRRLIDEGEPAVESISDHLLTGGQVGPDTDPAELYQAFMGYASTLAGLYAPMIERMRARGVKAPRMAVTELQLFAHFSGQPGGQGAGEQRLRPEQLPAPATISEALYLFTLLHALIRMEGTVELLTHSATVNHGGGLHKARERVWASPVHYAHAMAASMAGGTPLKVKAACDTYATTHVFGQIPPLQDVPVLDAMAALSADGERLTVTLVNRSATEPVEVRVAIEDLAVGAEAELVCLSGGTMYDQNTLEEPERIVPQASTVQVERGTEGHPEVRLPVAPFSLLRLTFDL